MLIKLILLILAAIFAAVVFLIAISSYSFNKKVEKEINKLAKDAEKSPTKIFKYNQLETLPEPVQRYFKYSLKDGQEYIRYARLKQTGEFKMKPDQGWKPIEAKQYFTTEIPAFLWQAKLKAAPFMWFTVRDMYYQGKGSMLGKLWSTFTVIDGKGEELDVSSLIRFLSEAPWFPTALLPSDYLEWTGINSNSARAVISDHGYTASIIFTFNDLGEIIELTTDDRYREVEGEYVKNKWTAYFRDYQVFNGMKIPSVGEVEWNLLDRNFKYAKLKVVDVQYNI